MINSIIFPILNIALYIICKNINLINFEVFVVVNISFIFMYVIDIHRIVKKG